MLDSRSDDDVDKSLPEARACSAAVTRRSSPVAANAPPSLTYKLPELCMVMPTGERKVARLPSPSAEPCTPLPANVEVKPVATEMLRMRWFCVSAAYRVRSVVGSRAMPPPAAG